MKHIISYTLIAVVFAFLSQAVYANADSSKTPKNCTTEEKILFPQCDKNKQTK